MSSRFAVILTTTLLIAVCCKSWGADSSARTVQAARKIAVEVCSACHGPAGDSTSPTFPKLAGQQESYLAAQLRAFKTKTRVDPDARDYMWGIVAAIDNSLIDPLAVYFSSQPTAAGRVVRSSLANEGSQIFEKGDAPRNIPPCASCHGANAEGQSAIPRLAGQHAPYLVRQIELMQRTLRQPAASSHTFVMHLAPDEVKAIADFLQSR